MRRLTPYAFFSLSTRPRYICTTLSCIHLMIYAHSETHGRSCKKIKEKVIRSVGGSFSCRSRSMAHEAAATQSTQTYTQQTYTQVSYALYTYTDIADTKNTCTHKKKKKRTYQLHVLRLAIVYVCVSLFFLPFFLLIFFFNQKLSHLHCTLL